MSAISSIKNESSSSVLPRLWSPKILSIVPSVRRAILVRHEPNLTEAQTAAAHVAFGAQWAVWSETYRDSVAKLAGIDRSDPVIDRSEEVRYRKDGKTPMIDLPELVAQPASGRRAFNLRNCAALCVDAYSSKLWARVGPYETKQGCSPEDLSDVLGEYRSFAERCADWFHDAFFAVTDPLLGGASARRREGRLEVTTLGLRVADEEHAGDFESWLLDEKGDPNLEKEELRNLLARAAGLDYDVRDLQSRQPNAFWLAMPTVVAQESGDLVSRVAAYLVRADDNLVHVAGVALDDSAAGDLATTIALKVSRWIASRI